MRLRKKEDSVGKHELAEERCSMGKHEFVWEEEPGGKLLFLGSKDDSARMNWVQGSKEWGTVRCPDGVEASVQRELLENGYQGSIQEVASIVGYDDAYHFSKLFKKRYGISPSQARRSS